MLQFDIYSCLRMAKPKSVSNLLLDSLEWKMNNTSYHSRGITIASDPTPHRKVTFIHVKQGKAVIGVNLFFDVLGTQNKQ